MATGDRDEDDSDPDQDLVALRQNGMRAVIESIIGTIALVTAVVVCYFMDRSNTYGVVPGADSKARDLVQLRFYALAPVLTGFFVLSEGIVIRLSDKEPISSHLPQVLQLFHLLRVLIALTMFAVLIGSLLESSGQPHCTLGLVVLTALCLGVWFNRLRKVIRCIERIVGTEQDRVAAAALTGI